MGRRMTGMQDSGRWRSEVGRIGVSGVLMENMVLRRMGNTA